MGSSPNFEEGNGDERSRWRRERESTYRQEYQNIRRRQEDRRSEGREEDNWGHRQRETTILSPRYEHGEEVEKRKALLVARERVQEKEDEDWLQKQSAESGIHEEQEDGDADMSGPSAVLKSSTMVKLFDITRSHDTLSEQVGYIQDDTDQLVEVVQRMQSQQQWTLQSVVTEQRREASKTTQWSGWPDWTLDKHRDPMIQWCIKEAGLEGYPVMVSHRVNEWTMSRVSEVSFFKDWQSKTLMSWYVRNYKNPKKPLQFYDNNT